MSVILRESLLINSVPFNSECWYAVTKAQINELAQVDISLARRVLSASPSVPVESLFLELVLTPVGHIIKGRRVMFLHYLVSLKEEEMLSKFFLAQWHNPVNHDWTVTVQKDLVDLGLNFDLSQIKKFKKEKFAEIVKKAIKAAAFSELMTRKQSHSKMKDLQYNELSMQNYLKSDLISFDKAKSLYKFRVRDVNVKNNRKTSNSDLNCPLHSSSNEDYLDDQHHLLHCSELVDHPAPTSDDGKCCSYQDIFGNDLPKMVLAINLLDKSMKIRLMAEQQNY